MAPYLAEVLMEMEDDEDRGGSPQAGERAEAVEAEPEDYAIAREGTSPRETPASM